MAGRPLIACVHCDTLYERVPIAAGAVASCTRCGTELYRNSRVSLGGWIALTLTGLIVFALSNYYPIARLNIQGHFLEATLPQALWLTWTNGHRVLAIMTGMFGFWMPLAQLLAMLWALMAVRSGRLPGDFRQGMRLLRFVIPWSMIPVLMLAIIVAVVKFAGLAVVELRPAAFGFAILAFLMTAMERVTPQRIWQYAEDAGIAPVSGHALSHPASHMVACHGCGYVQPAADALIAHEHAAVPDLLAYPVCGRCASPLHKRKKDAQRRAWALLIAAAIFYLPANLLPVMRIQTLASDSAHTILGGVLELWRLGSPDLALIVFVASIVVPVTKLLILMLLLLHRRWAGRDLARQRTRLYEFINFIGHWSMLDVFVVILMAAMANFPGISQVTAGPAAASFGLVVVLTMLAAECYDPRRVWDLEPGWSPDRAHVPDRAEPSSSRTMPVQE
ncbi:paraquat-inducible membrane protein A [Allopusillimonas soli]|uniref:Paraquat-inducible protein A n=1 Tax=Allopusillimonas soli TaxID=659016 RepID=A0A853FBP8_9BURK|nr:paraquat-inducible protein A [Allopusillimonas soli]NYT37062.1 paraquat-inducible protein A [Allopusillimonas soli]TEA75653.1 paraquat-inducible membrane protein A [Allopusillimonas soli]